MIQKLYDGFAKGDVGKAVGMKFMFVFHEVEVSVYFDGYDEELPVMVIIFMYKGECYFQPCNLLNLDKETFDDILQYGELSAQILEGGGTEGLFKCLLEEIERGQFVYRNYKADLPFKRLQRKNYEKYGISPFFGGIEKGEMEEVYKELLHKRLTLPLQVLEYIQKRGYTVRTVEKCKERKKLSKELNKLSGQKVLLSCKNVSWYL